MPLPLSATHIGFVLRLGLTAWCLLAATTHAQESVKVTTEHVQQSDLLREVPVTGTVTTARQSILSVEVPGVVESLAVSTGDQVAKGATLLRLDAELGEIALDSALAAREQAQQAKSESQRLLREAQTLARQNNIAESEVAARAARASIDEAELKAADANARQRQAELNRHQLKAPYAGVISQRMVDIGEWVTPGTPVFELVASEQLRLDFQVPQRFFPKVQPNSDLRVRFDAHPDQVFRARVHRTVPVTRDNARTFLLRAHLKTDVDRESPTLIPGMSVDGTLLLDEQRKGVTVPRDALIRYPDGRVSVWLVEPANGDETPTAREQQVKLGLIFGNRVEILSGIQPGQQVVVQGNEALVDNQAVSLVEPAEVSP